MAATLAAARLRREFARNAELHAARIGDHPPADVRLSPLGAGRKRRARSSGVSVPVSLPPLRF